MRPVYDMKRDDGECLVAAFATPTPHITKASDKKASFLDMIDFQSQIIVVKPPHSHSPKAGIPVGMPDAQLYFSNHRLMKA